MTTDIDDAVARIQEIALSLSNVAIKSAPEYPIENVDPLPMCVAFVGAGNYYTAFQTVYNFPTVNVEFHFSRLNLKLMTQQINAVVDEFPRRLSGDPDLNDTIETIVATNDQRVSYASRPFEWGKVTTQMLLFQVPLKLRKAPVTP